MLYRVSAAVLCTGPRETIRGPAVEAHPPQRALMTGRRARSCGGGRGLRLSALLPAAPVPGSRGLRWARLACPGVGRLRMPSLVALSMDPGWRRRSARGGCRGERRGGRRGGPGAPQGWAAVRRGRAGHARLAAAAAPLGVLRPAVGVGRPQHCPGPKPPLLAVTRPARSYKITIQKRFTMENAKGALTPSQGPDSGRRRR